MKARLGSFALVPLLTGCGYALGAGVYYEDHGYDDRRYDRYDRAYAYDYEYARRVDFRRLPVPRGHLPPPGQCRIWLPGVAPGHQPYPSSCRRLERRVPRGAWLLERPYDHPEIVTLMAYDYRRPGVRYHYVYDIRSGRRDRRHGY